MPRNLIIPGVAKAATTWFHFELDRQTGWCATREKETRFFRRPESLGDREAFLAEFDRPDEAVLVDANPQYLLMHASVFDRIEQVLGRGIHMLFCLRDPVHRGFSHYLHDLKSRLAVFDGTEISRDNSGGLFEAELLARYFRPMAPAIETALSRLDTDPLVFNFERDFDRLDVVAERLAAALDAPRPDLTTTVRHNPGGWMPNYLYHPNRTQELHQDGHRYIIPPRTLVLRNMLESRVWTDVPPGVGNRALASAASWTAWLEEADVDRLFDTYCAADLERTCSLLGVEAAEVRNPAPVNAMPARLGGDATAMLECRPEPAIDAVGVSRLADCLADVADSSTLEAGEKLDALDAAGDLATASPAGVYARALLEEKTGQTDEAVRNLLALVRMDPTNLKAMNRLVKLALKSGNPELALRMSARAVDLAPDDGKAWEARLRSAAMLGEDAIAIEAAERAKTLGSDHPVIGRVLNRAGAALENNED